MGGVTCPEILQSGTMSLVVLAMHEFGRHEDFIAIGKTGHSSEISRIVVRIEFVEIRPGVDDMTFLRVVSTEQAINCSIPSTFVTITPEHDTGMIHVTRQHFTNKTSTCRGIISILPTSQLVDVE